MKKQTIGIEDIIARLIFILLFIGLFYTGWYWLFELIVVLILISTFRELENKRNQFFSEIPPNALVSVPLKAEIYNKLFFSVGLIFLVFVLYFSLFGDKSNFLQNGAAIFGALFSVRYVISYFHQFIRQRKVFFTDEFIYFYEEEIIKIAFSDIKRIEYTNNQIFIFEEKIKTTLTFDKEVEVRKLKDVRNHLLQTASKHGYSVTNRQLK